MEKNVNLKFDYVLNKNKGFNQMKKICQILEGEEYINPENIIPKDLTTNDMTFFMFDPNTSVDAEKLFSVYKHFLTDNRRSYKFQNIKETLIVQYNSN